MFAHCGMLTLHADGWEESAKTIQTRLIELVGLIPGLESARVGVSAGVREGTASVMFVMEFDSEESWQAYGDHPAHQAVVKEAIGPVLESKQFFQTRSWETKALHS